MRRRKRGKEVGKNLNAPFADGGRLPSGVIGRGGAEEKKGIGI